MKHKVIFQLGLMNTKILTAEIVLLIFKRRNEYAASQYSFNLCQLIYVTVLSDTFLSLNSLREDTHTQNKHIIEMIISS